VRPGRRAPQRAAAAIRTAADGEDPAPQDLGPLRLLRDPAPARRGARGMPPRDPRRRADEGTRPADGASKVVGVRPESRRLPAAPRPPGRAAAGAPVTGHRAPFEEFKASYHDGYHEYFCDPRAPEAPTGRVGGGPGVGFRPGAPRHGRDGPAPRRAARR